MNGVALETAHSTYEVDLDNKLLRRVRGERPPTARVGMDGHWQPYAELVLRQDRCMVIIWNYTEGIARTTVTSPLRRVQYVSDHRHKEVSDAHGNTQD